MVASSSNLLLVAAATAQGHVRTGSTIPNDHDLTMTNFSTENRRGYMIRSTSTNNISGISGTNLKDMIMLETVAPAYASAPSALASVTAPSAPKEEGKQASGPRPRRKKMVSTGVDAMKKMLVTDSSVVVALPESPIVMVSRKHERAGEQRDDIDSVFNNIRATTNRKVLDFDLSVPAMPDMLSMPAPAPALPTPDVNRTSKLTNEMSNNSAAPPPMKKKKNQMGRRLLQMKKRLTYNKSKAGSKASSNKQVEVAAGHLSHGTSATTSTSSFGPSSQEEEDDVPFMDEMDMMTMNMTTTLKPRIRSMFPEDEEDMLLMPMMMPVLPAPPCPLSTPTAADVAVTTTPSSSFCSKLDQALSVLSPGDGDEDEDAVTDDDAGDEWGVFASDDDEEEEDHHHDDHPHNYNLKTKASSRSSFTKHTTINPCFAPRAHLPVFATAGAE